ncbi:craniofacial development protein 2-like [Anneissia japonica]|uniref:craniofacial development protein 2-like n=1 Tax=Anneissia japonica TaxID=1529436 RepID=UPI0014256B7A|nr:craniofacial development protein 2-like [Anneissia japonica]
MYEAGKTNQVIREMEKYNMEILEISECRWNGQGMIRHASGATICFSGQESGHYGGVALIINKKITKTLIYWEPINARIIRARFNSKYTKLTIIQCYAPTEDHCDEDKDTFYSTLEETVRKTPKHDVMVVMGDMNAKIGINNTGRERVMGKEGLGKMMNDNGERFADFCMENDLDIGESIFKHKDIYKETWVSPTGKTKNQIDHIPINRKWRTSLQDVKAKRGADVGSDHHLLASQIKLKLRKTSNKKPEILFNTQRLRDPVTRNIFEINLKNSFEVLEELPTEDIESGWTQFKQAFTETSSLVLGQKKKAWKTWMTPK